MILPMAPTPGRPLRRPHVVAALLPDRMVSLLELAAAEQIFGDADGDLDEELYELRLCGGARRRASAFDGLVLELAHGLEGLAGADTVIAMPWSDEEPPPAVLDALIAAHARGARMVSFCTGAFVLAAAGILDGRPATTHWQDTDELARRHPEVRVDPRVLYVDDGDVLTSAGAAASIDLALHLVRLDHGAEVANGVARRAVVPPHRDGGQAQYVEMPVPEAGPDAFADMLAWVLDHLGERLTVADLAERAHMSPRTFARHFRAVTGATPHQWLLRQRVLHAQALLETTDEPVEAVAHACGFGAASALRVHFQRGVGTSPQAYRRTFRGDREPAAAAGRAGAATTTGDAAA
jgi:transcriptional regulator GlxA family with amidase domain